MTRVHSALLLTLLAIIAFVAALSMEGNSGVQSNDGPRESLERNFVLADELERQPIPELIPELEPTQASRKVLVVDSTSKQPLQESQLRIRTHEGIRLASAEGDGAFLVSQPTPVDLDVICPGYVGRQVCLEEVRSEYVIELDRAETISGALYDQFGSSAPEGVTVLARKVGVPALPYSDFASGHRFSAGSEIVECKTDIYGHFQLDRLEKGADYRIRAVGLSIISQVSKPVIAGSIGVELRGAVLVAGRLQIETEQGGEPQVCRALQSSQHLGFTASDPDQTSIAYVADEYAKLAGASETFFTEDGRHQDDVYFGWAPFHSNGEHGFPFRWEAMGYESVQGWLSMTPVHLETPIQTLTVRDLGMTRGTLSVSIRQSEAPFSNATSKEDPNEFELYLERLEDVPDGERSTYVLRIDPRKPNQTFEHFPAGQYRITLFSEIGPIWRPLRTLPDSVLTVLPESTAEIEVDLSDTGVVEFILTDSELRDYDGSMVLRLKRIADGRTMHMDTRFVGPPYRLTGVPPGEYSVDFDAPDIKPLPTGTIVDSPGFLVEAGKRTTVDYQVADGQIHIRE